MYKQYCDLLHYEITQYNVEPGHTYNMDKKGFTIDILGCPKRVFSRRTWEKKEVTATV
jgi:hypothetical protein